MKRVFISYAHEDKDFLRSLEVHLQVLRSACIIASWHDGKIGAGEDWKANIDRELRAADIIVLLVSADFLASKSCQELELAPALRRWNAREVTVVPVLVRTCAWEVSPLARLQMLPAEAKAISTWAHQDDAWTEVTRKIRATALGTQISADTPQSPDAPTGTEGYPRAGPDAAGSATESIPRGPGASTAHAAPAYTTAPVAAAVPATRQQVPLPAIRLVPPSGQETDKRLRREAMVWAAAPGVLIAAGLMFKFFETSSKADMPIYGTGVGAFLLGAWASAIVVKGSDNTNTLKSLKTGGCVVVLASMTLVLAVMVRSCS